MRVRRGCQASQRKGLTSGEAWGTSGEVWGTSGEPLDCCLVPQRENFRGSRRKTSGEVRGTSGEVRGLPGSSGEPDSLPATRQICLQIEMCCNSCNSFEVCQWSVSRYRCWQIGFQHNETLFLHEYPQHTGISEMSVHDGRISRKCRAQMFLDIGAVKMAV